jgi:hypothetical protein
MNIYSSLEKFDKFTNSSVTKWSEDHKSRTMKYVELGYKKSLKYSKYKLPHTEIALMTSVFVSAMSNRTR